MKPTATALKVRPGGSGKNTTAPYSNSIPMITCRFEAETVEVTFQSGY